MYWEREIDVKSFRSAGLQNTLFQIFFKKFQEKYVKKYVKPTTLLNAVFEKYATRIFVLLRISIDLSHVLELNQENDRTNNFWTEGFG